MAGEPFDKLVGRALLDVLNVREDAIYPMPRILRGPRKQFAESRAFPGVIRSYKDSQTIGGDRDSLAAAKGDRCKTEPEQL